MRNSIHTVVIVFCANTPCQQRQNATSLQVRAIRTTDWIMKGKPILMKAMKET